jgi:phosphoserine phosphatase
MSQSAIDAHRQRVEMSSELFVRELDWFIKRYAPKDPHDCYEFQLTFMRLMHRAMQHQSTALSSGIDTYASQLYEQISLRPLHVIMKDK